MKRKKSLLAIIVVAAICLVAGSGTIINNVITVDGKPQAMLVSKEKRIAFLNSKRPTMIQYIRIAN